ncbi:hypothetical protein FQA39_LY14540 [Lamprigera yunnana]|nr:hypothetical protein FQA39_LY14540 [Lamprigera yunnana]
MGSNGQYTLNWSSHSSHLKKAFDSLLTENEFVDVTLSCEGKKITAHKMLLSACSTYFHYLFRDNPCQHPIVILKDVKFQNLVNVLKFMYLGEVSVPAENFDEFLKTAKEFQINGLADDEACAIEKESETNVMTETQMSETNSEKEINETARKRPHNIENNQNNEQKRLKEEVIYVETEFKKESEFLLEETDALDFDVPTPSEGDLLQPVEANLNTTFSEIARIRVQLENTERLLKQNFAPKILVVPEGNSELYRDSNFENLFKFPLDTVEDINRLDTELLKNQSYCDYLWQLYTLQFGRDGKKEGNKIGRKLVEMLFTPKIMTCFSWTGHTRAGEKKSPFGTLRGFLAIFTKVMQSADYKWCTTMTESFFKTKILKFSVQRKKAIETKQAKRFINLSMGSDSNNSREKQEEGEENNGNGESEDTDTEEII